jgi:XTP/dITP diphosphohydrolase
LASELLIATRSADKLKEIRAVLGSAVQARLLTLDDVAIAASPAEDDIEIHSTFIENAVAKAQYFAEISGMRVIADDSGLCVAALAGAPGVRTKRFAIDEAFVGRDVAGKQLDDANNQLLLEKLRGVAESARAAHYVCAAAFADAVGRITTSLGTCTGSIAFQPRGSGGFGYDPLFLIPDLAVTFAQLSREQKHAHSHRARAFRALASHVK